ncbi:MAG: hypothetical protein HQL27_01950 [Candidatus Omnitrophica bacterium]|nr:hypothetical protein [Candidatus Omnitrophota bacterium]
MIYNLKKGLYELSYPRELFIPDFYTAKRLYAPSYVSLETALSNYSIIPEVAMSVTSITSKPTRSFKNRHGLFTYRTVKKEAFCGYYVQKQNSFEYLIAEPEKALIDYFYFKKFDDKSYDIDEARMDRNMLAKLKRPKLNKYAKQFNLTLKEFYADI